jgi:syntaxin-binding protein 1
VKRVVSTVVCVNSRLQNSRRKQCSVERKKRETGFSYKLSRWIPVVKDIMEDCIEEKLDQEHFPYLTNQTRRTSYCVPTSARYRNWEKDKTQPVTRNLPRLIVFIVGGMSYSEMRSAYEVTKACKNWEVIIGSSHILTPEGFLSDLGDLSEIPKDVSQVVEIPESQDVDNS